MHLKFGPPRFWQDKKPNWQAKALLPLSWLVGAIIRLRAFRTTPVISPLPVLCCGNLSVGGTGKTILVRDLAQRLANRGEHPHILSRGYGGRLDGPLRVDTAIHTARDVGDEPFMLAQEFPVWIGADRSKTAQCAVDSGATCLVMDDGLQNPTLKQTFRLVTMDGGIGLGNGQTLPAGPLRESPTRGLSRVDAVILIGRDDTQVVTLLHLNCLTSPRN
nr:tetraacyldisaccharide 4'-kinase [Asaia prunellae]